MVDFTLTGTWFRWSELDSRSRWLAAGSMICAAAGGMLIALDLHSRLGLRSPRSPVPQFEPWMGWFVLVSLLVSAGLWWRFTLRQDEMFRQAQNWALGQAACWAMALGAICSCIAMTGWIRPVSGLDLIVAFALANTFTWFWALRRWL